MSSAGSATTAPTPGDPGSRQPGGATFGELFAALVSSAERAIHGKSEVVRAALTCLLAEGHLLIEDVPGVGKTSLAKALAKSMQLHFSRIQFTPDLLPSDVVGSTVWNAGDGSIEFRPGPVFSNVLLGDEINRASPKTQAALLESMEEHQVTADGVTRALPDPFMVIATQNPVEHHGTFPLPESQLDRFLMRLSVGYPDESHEIRLLTETDHEHSLDRVAPVLDAGGVSAMIRAAAGVHVADSVAHYVVRIASATRSDPDVVAGVSPRACLGLLRAARVRAAADGRDFVTPDDVKALAPAVLSHRIVLSAGAATSGGDVTSFIDRTVAGIPVSV